jgi:hypothetical protein
MVHSDISILGFSKFIKALLFLRSFLALPLGYIVSYCPFLIGFFNPMRSMGMKKHVFLRTIAISFRRVPYVLSPSLLREALMRQALK